MPRSAPRTRCPACRATTTRTDLTAWMLDHDRPAGGHCDHGTRQAMEGDVPRPRTNASQVAALRLGLELARLLVERPRRVEELVEELEVQPRSVQRLLAGLRDADVEIESEVRHQRERYYSIKVVPTWLARAVRVIGRVTTP